jgi:protein associated with RNAse G/E
LRPVLLSYTKHPGRPHWIHETVEIGRDEHGTWLGMAVGSRYRKGPEPWLRNEIAAVLCVPHDGWWCLLHNGDEHRLTDYVDICTPPRWDGDRVTMVDLDLDVVRTSSGHVEIVDRDEFDEHRVALGYPADWVASAEAAAAKVADRLAAEVPPFGATARAWRERFVAVSG